jgi:hypothetical protein
MILKGILKSFDSSTHKATVQIVGSLTTWLSDVPTSHALLPSDMVAGRYVAVLTPDPAKPGESVVIGLWAPSTPPTGVSGDDLSQDFGAGGERLKTVILDAQAGMALRINNCAVSSLAGEDTFVAKINAGGSGGLTATNVPYDNDSNEDIFNGLQAYDGSAYWGQIILHNTTRGNSRKVVSFDRTNNKITTTASTDDWADNDDITTGSQTITGGDGFMDLDLSAKIPATAYGLFVSLIMYDSEGTRDTMRQLLVHPYESYDGAKTMTCFSTLAYERTEIVLGVKLISQTIGIRPVRGIDNCYIFIKVRGYWEYADT